MQFTKWVQEPIWISKDKVILWPWSKSVGFKFSNFFFLETARLIEAKFYVEPKWDRRMEVSKNDLRYMTKMADMSIYGKNV